MSPQYEFPHADVGTNQPELFIRDIEFLNYHINHDKWDWFRNFGIIDAHRDGDDFDVYAAGDWTINATGAGATEALEDIVNGVLSLTTGATENDGDELTRVPEAFLLHDGNPFYAEMRFKISEVIQCDFWFGLITGNTWFTPPDDYAVFHKEDGDVNLDFSCAMNGTATDVDTTIDLEAITWLRIGFHWDGHDTIRWFVFTDSDEPQICAATGTITTNIPTDEYMTIGFGFLTGETAEKILYVDYFKAVQKRVIE
jgi:hypothetical protein